MQEKKLLVSKKYQEEKIKYLLKLTAKSLVIIILIWAVFLLVQPVLAADVEVGLEYAKGTGLGTTDIRITIATIIRAALGFLGIIAVLIILYGGYIYMTSAGNPEKVEKAKRILRDAIIGLLIILSAFAIAHFILRYLLAATGLAPIGPPPYGSGGGALGNGILESHYPARNALGVPRNTSIVVTFKETMCVDSISKTETIDGQPVDVIILDSIKIHKTADKNGPFVTAVKAYHTEDLKTFVFKPIDPLGSPDEPINYTVELTNNITKFDCKTNAFGVYGGYDWGFEVSTFLDLTPPKISSVIPRPANNPGQTVPRNMVVQINFNEAINPMTMRGLVELVGGSTVTVGQLKNDNGRIITFNNINVYKEPNAGGDQFIAGEFLYSNQYRTVEFITNDLCGKNTCGGDVFCLPGPANISILVRAANLDDPPKPSASFPYTGIIDMCDNSLDGNKNGTAQGPQSQSGKVPYYINLPDADVQGDDSKWSFFTSDKIDLVPPEISSYYPGANEIDISPMTNFEITFDKLMMSNTLKPDSGYGDGYCPCQTNDDCPAGTCDPVNAYCLNGEAKRFECTPTTPCLKGQNCIQNEYITLVQPPKAVLEAKLYPGGGWAYWLASENSFINHVEGITMAIIDHYKPLGEFLIFRIRAGSGVKDLMQNCFQPCAGPGCEKSEIRPGEYEPVPGKWLPNEASFPTCTIP